MHTVQRTLRENRPFLLGCFLLLCAMLLFGGFHSKDTCFLQLNVLHTRLLDQFFVYYTYLGDGWLVVLLLPCLLLFRRSLLAFEIVTAYLASGLVAQGIKRLVPAPRPKVFFQPQDYTSFIEGVTRGGWASFPSGHTATAFAVATILALQARNKLLGLMYLLLAAGVGYSRIYLGQHFLEDVTGGLIIGVFLAAVIHVLVRRVRNKQGETTSSAMMMQ